MNEVEVGLDGAAPGVTAVEVFDDRSRLCESFALLPGACRALRLDRSGDYLVRGWLATGQVIEMAVAVGPARSVVRLVAPDPPGRAAYRLGEPTWALLCRWHNGRWRQATPITEIGAATLEFARVQAPPGAPVAIQLGDERGPSATVVAPTGTPIRLPDLAFGGEGRPEALGWALLDFLHQGDVRSAGHVAGELLRVDEPKSAYRIVADLALAYYWLGTADPRLPDLSSTLTRLYPSSPDAAVIAVWTRLHGGRMDAALRRQTLRAADLGVPVAAVGLRLLASALTVCQQQASDREASRVLTRLWSLENACISQPATAYCSLTPDRPVAAWLAPPVARPWSQRYEIQAGSPVTRPGKGDGRWRSWLWKLLSANMIPRPVVADLLFGIASMAANARIRDSTRRSDRYGLALRMDLFEEIADLVLAQRANTWADSLQGLRRMFREFMRPGSDVTDLDSLWRPLRPDDTPSLPRLELLGPRTAATDPADTARRPAIRGRSARWRLAVHAQYTSEGLVSVTVEPEGGPSPEALVVSLHASTFGLDTVYLVIITPAGAAGEISIPGVLRWLDLAVTDVRPAASLEETDAAAIERSAALADRNGRNAWRAVARDRASGDPVADAITRALTVPSEPR